MSVHRSTAAKELVLERDDQVGRGEPRIAIIGAGLGGIATAVNLTKRGIRSFTVFEASAGPGGTWWDNTYPGCAVDVESHAYSYSFFPYDWSGTHAKQAELQQYAETVIDHFVMRDRFRFESGVSKVEWDDELMLYHLTLASGETGDFEIVVSCLGMLNVPKYPNWPGLATFNGPCFHTARWEHQHDLNGKRVGFVGTGSTSAQVVPAIAAHTKELHVFQREPGWVVPKGDRLYTEQERRRYQRWPILQRWHKAKFFYRYARLYRAYDATSKQQKKVRNLCLAHIESSIPNEQLRAMVTPSYPYGCKRGVQSNEFYPALCRDNVSLHPYEVTRVTSDGVVTSDGSHHGLDVLILGTGFHTTNYLSTLEVRGVDHHSLHDVWEGEPFAFLGMTVTGFPNFFILYGPNTNGGAIIIQLERQAEVVARTVRKMIRRREKTVDTKASVLKWYVEWIQDRCIKRSSALESGCHSYYHSESGRNVTQWPGDQYLHWLVSRTLPAFGLTPKVQSAGALKSMVRSWKNGSSLPAAKEATLGSHN